MNDVPVRFGPTVTRQAEPPVVPSSNGGPVLLLSTLLLGFSLCAIVAVLQSPRQWRNELLSPLCRHHFNILVCPDPVVWECSICGERCVDTGEGYLEPL